MIFSIAFVSEVYNDLDDITQWYASQRENLDSEFLLSFEATILLIKRNPYQYEDKFDGVRVALLHRFPYRTIYKIYTDNIIVFGVFHTSRSPKLISKRIQ